MAPIYVKGGIWTNVEDEILKASIAKYGLNQWPRVSSLLARKTAKQCKARWHEWLAPSVKKLSWSKKEDEKLLRLTKIMPNQWRSIAPIIGRTPTQCIERYQQLLDDHEYLSNEQNAVSDLKLQGLGAEAHSNAINDAARVSGSNLQVGDINLNPESRPARPDAIDMDDDEKEMLSEARARLANTQGKKAKRKARERMIDETNRISMIQKRRELKQSGISLKFKLKKKFKEQMDYNLDIPLQRVPESGRFDTENEDGLNSKEKQKFDKLTERKGTENQEFKKRQEKQKKRKDIDAKNDKKASLSIVMEGSATDESVNDRIKRRKLVLPEPTTESTKVTIEDSNIEDTGFGASINEIEARTYTQSALLARREAFNEESDDEDEIKKEQNNDDNISLIAAVKSEPREEKSLPKLSLKSKLLNLPKPLNDFEIEFNSDDDDDIFGDFKESDKLSNNKSILIPQDRAEEEKQEQLKAEEEERKRFLSQTQVLQRNLLIPNILEMDNSNSVMTKNLTTKEKAELEVNDEMIILIKSDYAKTHPELKRQDLIKEDLEYDTIQKISNIIKEEMDQEVPNDNFVKIIDSNLAKNKSTSISLENISSYMSTLKKTAQRANKLEKLLDVTFGGYVKIQNGIIDKRKVLNNELGILNRDYNIYSNILEEEALAIQNRKASLQEGVEDLSKAEQAVQRKFRELYSR
ncbi:hypothetical protein B5S28_g114 [[Candida] boidinii]|nr:hypothetical protein B5S28_g114 [[Candida] boidinii]OWB76355.1 hypothetical protein B5S32_g506 [[Candida] boidinii]